MISFDEEKPSLICKLNRIINNGNNFCSFEISPPRNSTDVPAVLKSIDVIKEQCDPLFYSITWHLRTLPTLTTELIPYVFNIISAREDQELLIHVAAAGLSQMMILDISKKALAHGIKNIFALRGDKRNDFEIKDFPHAVNLVQFLRKQFGKSVTICVAGYPEGHPESHSLEDDLRYLKEKVDAGADFIITQIIFDADVFERFVDRCRDIGITVPIVPGILPIQDFKSLHRISRMCHFNVPKGIYDILEPIQDNKIAVQSFGINYATMMAKQILSSKKTSGIHLFTMNRCNKQLNLVLQV